MSGGVSSLHAGRMGHCSKLANTRLGLNGYRMRAPTKPEGALVASLEQGQHLSKLCPGEMSKP